MSPMTSNPLLTGGMLDADFRNPWRILKIYNSTPQGGVAVSSGFLDFDKLRCLLVEVRSWFDENPEVEP